MPLKIEIIAIISGLLVITACGDNKDIPALEPAPGTLIPPSENPIACKIPPVTEANRFRVIPAYTVTGADTRLLYSAIDSEGTPWALWAISTPNDGYPTTLQHVITRYQGNTWDIFHQVPEQNGPIDCKWENPPNFSIDSQDRMLLSWADCTPSSQEHAKDYHSTSLHYQSYHKDTGWSEPNILAEQSSAPETVYEFLKVAINPLTGVAAAFWNKASHLDNAYLFDEELSPEERSSKQELGVSIYLPDSGWQPATTWSIPSHENHRVPINHYSNFVHITENDKIAFYCEFTGYKIVPEPIDPQAIVTIPSSNSYDYEYAFSSSAENTWNEIIDESKRSTFIGYGQRDFKGRLQYLQTSGSLSQYNSKLLIFDSNNFEQISSTLIFDNITGIYFPDLYAFKPFAIRSTMNDREEWLFATLREIDPESSIATYEFRMAKTDGPQVELTDPVFHTEEHPDVSAEDINISVRMLEDSSGYAILHGTPSDTSNTIVYPTLRFTPNGQLTKGRDLSINTPPSSNQSIKLHIHNSCAHQANVLVEHTRTCIRLSDC